MTEPGSGGDVPDWWRWHAGPVPSGSTIVFDMDGVLSDASTRQHFFEGGGDVDWPAFFAACGDDVVIAETARLLEVLDPAHRVVLLTARPLSVRNETLAWLERYGLRWDLLIMRPDHGSWASDEFKRGELDALRSRGFDVRLAFEDDPRNAAMFRDAGVPCVYIHSGYYGPAPERSFLIESLDTEGD